MHIIYFDDRAIANLHPITLTRKASRISCGGYHLEELISTIFSPERVTREQGEHAFSWRWRAKEQSLELNSRMIPEAKQILGIQRMIAQGQAKGRAPLFHYPWEVILESNRILKANLTLRSRHYRKNRNGIYLGQDVRIHPQAVVDSTGGPVILEQGVRVDPFAVLRGPLYVGAQTIIKDFTTLSHAMIGSVCKLAGEIEESVIEGYTNKQHYGFVGHSYIGSWVNLGAGTTFSDLKNTYGEIQVDWGQGKFKTGTQFLGAVVGDYVKTAINTSVASGKLIGPNSFLYGLVSESVPAFTNYYNGRKVEFFLTEAYKVQARMYARRDLLQTGADKAVLRRAYLATQVDRERDQVARGDFKL